MSLPEYVDKVKVSSIKVKGYRLMVKADPIEEISKGGIVLSVDKTRERAAQNIGTVVSIGDQCFTQYEGEPWCEVGDTVLYSRYAGKFVMDPVTQEEYVLLNDEDVIATIEENPENGN